MVDGKGREGSNSSRQGCSPMPAFSSPEIVALTSASGQMSTLWPIWLGEVDAEASARDCLVGVLPVVLNGDLYGLLGAAQAPLSLTQPGDHINPDHHANLIAARCASIECVNVHA